MSFPQVHRLLLDVSSPSNFPPSLAPPGASRAATQSWLQLPQITHALSLLPAGATEERAKVSRFFRASDAALSLASSLLKHVAIARATGTPWQSTLVTQERHIDNGKPFFAGGGVQFNASHHGEVGVLAWASGADGGTGSGMESGTGVAGDESTIPKVGIDVVTIDAAKSLSDLRRTAREPGGRRHAWREWARIFRDAFTDGEMTVIERGGRESEPGPTLDELEADPAALDTALRTFHAYWALKEAYIKMTSEAFMADWLRELEFRRVRIPRPAGEEELQANRWAEGETVRDIEVWLRGERVEGVLIEVQALGRDYMVATAVERAAEVRGVELVTVGDVEALAR